MELYDYMLYRSLIAEDTVYLTAHLKKFQRDRLNRFVPEDKIDVLLNYIKEKEVQAITNLVGRENVLEKNA